MFKLTRPEPTTKKCRACASDIPLAANLCSICKTPQTKMGIALQGLAGNLAVIAGIASLAVWGVTNWPKMMAVAHPTYILKPINAGAEQGAFINSGNHAIYVRTITYQLIYVHPVVTLTVDGIPKRYTNFTVSTSGIVQINRVVEPGKVLRYKAENKDVLTGSGGFGIMRNTSPEEERETKDDEVRWSQAWKEKSDSARNNDASGSRYDTMPPPVLNAPTIPLYWNKLSQCADFKTFQEDDPQLTALGHDTVNESPFLIKTKATVLYYSVDDKASQYKVSVPSVTLVLPKAPSPKGCEDSMDFIIPSSD